MTGQDIKNYRTRRGVTLAEAGRELHISAQAVAKAERKGAITDATFLRYTAAIDAAQTDKVRRGELAAAGAES